MPTQKAAEIIAQKTTEAVSQNVSLTLCLPPWFCVLFSLGFVIFLLYVGGLHEKLKYICSEFPKVRDAFMRASEALVTKGILPSNPLFSSSSPIRLTPAGEQLMIDINFNNFYTTNRNILLERIRSKNPQTMADLEEATKAIMLQMESTISGFELIKQWAYQHGQPLADILFACGIKLKDLAAAELHITT